MEQHTMKVIARIRSDFPEKFGIPRQSGLVPELRSKIVFEPEFRNADALRGMGRTFIGSSSSSSSPREPKKTYITNIRHDTTKTASAMLNTAKLTNSSLNMSTT